ncbi:MAG: CapA family protein [Leptospira sp.]|nr:CapA family protein [Leptospira sp.]
MRIQFVGDLMCHNSQLISAFDSKNQSYNFDRSFQWVKSKIQNSDRSFGNLETTIPISPRDYSGYPKFGSPPEFVQTLSRTGFDVLSTANNHSADKGPEAIDHTIDTVSKNGLVPIGTYKNLDDYETRRYYLFSENGIKFGILNYTYSTNGIKVTGGRIVRLLDREMISEDVRYLKLLNVHFVILWFHYGTEYYVEPDKSQLEWVNHGFSAGADLIIGGHPHVVQKFEKRNVIGEDGKNKEQYVAFSLGNFLSAQNMSFTDGGTILNLDLSVDSRGNKKVARFEFEPVWVLSRGYQVIPINEYKRGELGIVLSKMEEKRMNQYLDAFHKIIPLQN